MIYLPSKFGNLIILDKGASAAHSSKMPYEQEINLAWAHIKLNCTYGPTQDGKSNALTKIRINS